MTFTTISTTPPTPQEETPTPPPPGNCPSHRSNNSQSLSPWVLAFVMENVLKAVKIRGFFSSYQKQEDIFSWLLSGRIWWFPGCKPHKSGGWLRPWPPGISQSCYSTINLPQFIKATIQALLQVCGYKVISPGKLISAILCIYLSLLISGRWFVLQPYFFWWVQEKPLIFSTAFFLL